MTPDYQSIRLCSYWLFPPWNNDFVTHTGGPHSRPNELENTPVSEHRLRSGSYVSACSAYYPIVCQSSIWFLAFTMMTIRLPRSMPLPPHTADNKKSSPKKWVGLFIQRSLSVFFNLIATFIISMRQSKEKSPELKSGAFTMNTGFSRGLTPIHRTVCPGAAVLSLCFNPFHYKNKKSSKPKLEALWCG